MNGRDWKLVQFVQQKQNEKKYDKGDTVDASNQ